MELESIHDISHYFTMEKANIRNFCIVAHVDHGKSTLADRMLEITGTVPKEKLREQFLDQNPISRRRGITIKLAPVRMNYTLPAITYTLNLIDTPGHIDFSYEVSRTLAACEGVVLLVDATQGIQAQTVAHFEAAKKEKLAIIPVVNKIDLANAQIEKTTKELMDFFGFQKKDIILISAKTGQNVPRLILEIIQKIPPPKGFKNLPLRALIFDAVYDEYRGVIAYVRIIDGEVQAKDRIQLFQNGVTTEISEVGYFSPFLQPLGALSTGEIGYITTGIKNIKDCRIGDTIINGKWKMENGKLTPLPGYTIPKPMVFLGIYPKNTDDLIRLKEALIKLSLNDASLGFIEEYSNYLGNGYRVGFLGLLHAEIIKERLKKEFDLDLLLTQPHVSYKTTDGTIREPYMKLTVYTPTIYVGKIMTVCQKNKGSLLDLSYHNSSAVLQYEMPYSVLTRGLSAEIKSVSAGFASLDYVPISYRDANLAKLEVRINHFPIDVLSEYVYKEEAMLKARKKLSVLKEALPRQQFRQIIQGVLDDTVVAREEIPPLRKDVLAKLSGGDRTRKDKLLDKQRKGKSKLFAKARIVLPQEALFSLIESL